MSNGQKHRILTAYGISPRLKILGSYQVLNVSNHLGLLSCFPGLLGLSIAIDIFIYDLPFFI